MLYKRPNFKMGGSPTGIESLTPRVKAQSGFLGQTPLFFRDSRQIGLDFPSTITGMQIPMNNQIMMKSFPQDASSMGVASIAKKPLSSTQKLDKEMSEMIEIGGYGTIPKGPEIDITKLSDTMLKILGTAETREELEKRKENKKSELKDDFETEGGVAKVLPGETALDAVLREGKIISEKKAKETGKGDIGDADLSKDTDPGGEVVEDSFDSIFNKQLSRLEKYLGSTNRETKGKVALALSDAVGTPGSLADKAAVLNKALLGIAATKKKDKRELAKLAFAATTELEKADIAAGKKGFSERRFDEYANLATIKNRTPEQEKRFEILKDGLGIKSGLTGPSATAAGKIATEVNKSIVELQTASEDEKANIQSEIIAGINQLLLIQGVTRDNVSGIIGFDVSNYLKADGGRIQKAMGGPTETPAEPVATNLTFEQLRTRLPKEITDDIVRLVATSEEALQDFAYIRTQGDVEKFNVKYGVNLVLPQTTA